MPDGGWYQGAESQADEGSGEVVWSLFSAGLWMEYVGFIAEYLTAGKGVNLKPLLHWSDALYQQALDMGVQGTHTRLLGESPLIPYLRKLRKLE